MGPPNYWYSDWIYPRLTTPIAYVSTIPTDGFAINEFKDNVHRYTGGHHDYYPSWNINEVVKANNGQPGWGGVAVLNAVRAGSHILTVSRGPDKLEDIGGSPPTGVLVYDASNGLHSSGDIYRDPRWSAHLAQAVSTGLNSRIRIIRSRAIPDSPPGFSPCKLDNARVSVVVSIIYDHQFNT